jgi:hypothetical protein
MWRNAHIAVLVRASTLRLRHRPRTPEEFQLWLHQQDATFSSNSAGDPASLVLTISRNAQPPLFSAV